ncbi:translation machinery-associated protein 16 [Blastocladiella emersonii ATCC 22665]|nr:translation machinery-associated protein 16 [Blastocladiella emersonii ATCC 22665]
MPNNKVKSLKKLGKVENVHPYSRKAKQARRAMHREDRLAKTKDARGAFKVNLIVDQYMFLKSCLPEGVTSLSQEQVYEVINKWLGRHDEELATLVKERNAAVHGKKSPREDLIEAMVAQERSEYEVHGITIPNLQSTKVVKVLREWGGDTNQLDLIKTILVRPPKKGSAAASTEGANAAAPAQKANKDLTPEELFKRKMAEATGMTLDD